MNLTETRGVIITSSPVFGLRANRSDCCQGTKDPNPFMEIDSPSRIPFATTVGNAFTTAQQHFSAILFLPQEIVLILLYSY